MWLPEQDLNNSDNSRHPNADGGGLQVSWAPPLEEEHKQLTPAEKGGLAFQQPETPRGQPSKPQTGSTEEIQQFVFIC